MIKLLVEIRPFPGMLGFYRTFTRSLVNIDGVETEAVWGGVTEIPVEAGSHDIAVYLRYRFQREARLGLGRAEFTADSSLTELRAQAKLGPFNQSRFRITVGEG